ncbi:MAG: hypothetical protein ACOC4R_01995 [Bacteroidota bacterium]
MSKVLSIIIAVVLLGSTIYFFQESRHFKDRLVLQEQNHQAQLKQTEDEYEKRIARMRNEYEKKLADFREAGPQEKISDFFKMIQGHMEESRNKLIQEISNTLDLTEQELMDVQNSIAYMENQQRLLKNKANEEGLNIFSSEHLDQVNKHRKETMNLLRKALPEEKFELFMEHGFHEKLNLQTQQP